ncbi:hypothetical protein Q4567_19710 [Aliiglaciecola sp. 2_MG-2023]|uniref:hypothetical protein n=1 Tax=unclassified Aliiglaciecola TaxID=2593648 RepID=UPI0026E29A98|nr:MULTISPECIES: hypothetical protein [unclassified Aliiglaciecola]MDO6712971.1 hypothetical protein [Aliiglaciecola sp. 2_MG-2023]MDO6754010.1 hypothetical protein [Aliiglaciecola sp. 1_MG-2023]
MSFQAFIKAAKSIITIGSSANATSRQEIIDVVGSLSDELDRALSLTDSYLIGAKFSVDDNELARYLADVDGTLMRSYHEHHVCAALYHLADKFDQIFDPTRFSVDITSYKEIPRLIDELKNGEQVVLDDLQEIAIKLRDYSNELHSGSTSRDDILKAIEYHRKEIETYRKQIKAKRRNLLSKI